MDLRKSHYEVEVHHPFAGKVTLFVRLPSDDEHIKFKHHTVRVLQSAFKDKLKDNEGKLLKKKTNMGIGLVVGLKAPVQTKSGEFKDGFALDGKPVFCTPDTGECYPENWKDLLAEKVPVIFDAVADRLFGNLFAATEKAPGEEDLDDDEPTGAGEEGKK